MIANTDILQIINPEFSFVQEIEKRVRETGAEYLDCILDFCSRRGLEQEQVIHIIRTNPEFKAKLQTEAEGLNLLKDLPPPKPKKKKRKKKK